MRFKNFKNTFGSSPGLHNSCDGNVLGLLEAKEIMFLPVLQTRCRQRWKTRSPARHWTGNRQTGCCPRCSARLPICPLLSPLPVAPADRPLPLRFRCCSRRSCSQCGDVFACLPDCRPTGSRSETKRTGFLQENNNNNSKKTSEAYKIVSSDLDRLVARRSLESMRLSDLLPVRLLGFEFRLMLRIGFLRLFRYHATAPEPYNVHFYLEKSFFFARKKSIMRLDLRSLNSLNSKQVQMLKRVKFIHP